MVVTCITASGSASTAVSSATSTAFDGTENGWLQITASVGWRGGTDGSATVYFGAQALVVFGCSWFSNNRLALGIGGPALDCPATAWNGTLADVQMYPGLVNSDQALSLALSARTAAVQLTALSASPPPFPAPLSPLEQSLDSAVIPGLFQLPWNVSHLWRGAAESQTVS